MNEDGELKPTERIKQMPIYIKAFELIAMCDRIKIIVESESEEFLKTENGDTLLVYCQLLENNSTMLPQRIIDAEIINRYVVRMEQAAVIRKRASDIGIYCTYMGIFGFKEKDYLKLLKKEVDEFRVLFIEWIKTFNTSKLIGDRWGLFNPPNIDYDDIC